MPLNQGKRLECPMAFVFDPMAWREGRFSRKDTKSVLICHSDTLGLVRSLRILRVAEVPVYRSQGGRLEDEDKQAYLHLRRAPCRFSAIPLSWLQTYPYRRFSPLGPWRLGVRPPCINQGII